MIVRWLRKQMREAALLWTGWRLLSLDPIMLLSENEEARAKATELKRGAERWIQVACLYRDAAAFMQSDVPLLAKVACLSNLQWAILRCLRARRS
jgi:hypothetical protein